MFKDRIEHIGKDGEPLKMRSDLEIGRRLAFVLELIARGEVKAKLPKDAPLLDGLEVPERDLAGREFATSQIASHCGSSKVGENREPQAKTEAGGRDRGRGASAGVMAFFEKQSKEIE